MRKYIFTSVVTVITAVVIFYFNIAGGKDGSIPVSNSTENRDNNGYEETGNNFESYVSSFYSASRYSPRSGGWQLQTMPNMGNRLVRDLYFTDSLTGYAVASPDTPVDSAHILKTTDGGTVWQKILTKNGRLKRIVFINSNTGFAGGSYLLKTTNSGGNWNVWNWPLDRIIYDMQVFSEDTIWYGDTDPIAGGAYRTTNGGINWEKRDSGIPANSYPFYIYFYNSRIGFATGGTNVYKTTDAGQSWNLIFSGGAQKLYFKDSLNGYRAMQGFFRTTNGGVNWSKDSLPHVLGNTVTVKWLSNFSIVNNLTIYGVGAYFQYTSNLSVKPIIYKTTNGGINWGYQIPDTSYNIYNFSTIYSMNKNVWCYDNYYNKGIYTSIGGDTTIYLGVRNISNEIPVKYELFQNYPNPFNQTTIIRYQITISGFVQIKVYDINGRLVQTLINERLRPGTYETRFDGGNMSSGIYFYRLITNNELLKSRKMVMIN